MIVMFPHTGHRVHHKEVKVFSARFPRHSHSVFCMDVAVCRLTLLPKFPMPVFSAHRKGHLSSYIWDPKGMQLQAGIKQFLCQTDYTGFSVCSQLTPSFFE